MKLNIKPFFDNSAYTKAEIARELGISYPTMLSIYQGEAKTINLSTLEKLCVFFNCTPNDILESDKIQIQSSSERQTLDKIIEVLSSKDAKLSVQASDNNDKIVLIIDPLNEINPPEDHD